MKYLLFLLPTFLLFACSTATEDQTELDAIRDRYAPDRRTERVELWRENGTLTGYTTDTEAYALINRSEPGNQVRLLPDTNLLGKRTAGLVRVATANLRSEPGHSQELATQALLGTPLQVLDSVDGWFLVRTPDRYIAWLEPGAFVRTTQPAARAYLNDPGLRTVSYDTELLSANGTILTTLPRGSLVRQSDNLGDDNSLSVTLPDEQSGEVEAAALMTPTVRPDSADFSTEEILATARTLAGRPYLWGGTSPIAMDCSGFTKLTYQLNGYVIPRDASQQVHAGVEIPLDPDRRNYGRLRAGDLLFFGSYRDDGSQRITHVGFYLGDGRFLHAGADNGRITENSLLETDPDFAEHRRNSLLRAKRLRPGDVRVSHLDGAFNELIGKRYLD